MEINKDIDTNVYLTETNLSDMNDVIKEASKIDKSIGASLKSLHDSIEKHTSQHRSYGQRELTKEYFLKTLL